MSEGPEVINITKAFDKQISSTVEGDAASVKYIPDFLSKEDADALYEHLKNNLNWQQREGATKTGISYPEPRLTTWFGKPYKYSNVSWDENLSWDPELESLCNQLTDKFAKDKNIQFDSVMCNYYRDNKDSIGWHADDELSLGTFPLIASISLGCERVFEVCRRVEYYSRNYCSEDNPVFPGCTILYKFHLSHGSLLIMDGSMQDDWLHRVPKDNTKMDGRINLTFRHIVSEAEEEAEKDRRNTVRKKAKANNTWKYGEKNFRCDNWENTRENYRGNRYYKREYPREFTRKNTREHRYNPEENREEFRRKNTGERRHNPRNNKDEITEEFTREDTKRNKNYMGKNTRERGYYPRGNTMENTEDRIKKGTENYGQWTRKTENSNRKPKTDSPVSNKEAYKDFDRYNENMKNSQKF